MSEDQLTPPDASLSQSIAGAVGHGPPFSPSECARVKRLAVRHAADIEFIEHLDGLEELEVFACAARRLPPLRRLSALRTLRVLCTPITSLEEIAGHPALEHVEVAFTAVEDLQPLLEVPTLKTARLPGNPWSPESWRKAREHFWALRSGPTPLVEFSSPLDHGYTRQLWQNGARLCVATLDDLRPVLVRPGFGLLPGSDCDGVSAGEWAFHDLLIHKDSPEDVMRRVAASPPRRLSRRDLDSERILGDSTEAARWVRDSSLSAEDKDNLLSFVTRFSGLTFFKDPAELVARHFPLSGPLSIPPWLREIQSVLAGICPGSEVSWRFDESVAPRFGDAWYRFGLMHGEKSWCEMLRELASVRPIAECGGASTLAVDVSGEDQAVYEFYQPDLEEALSEDRLPSEELDKWFTSYTSMLRHVTAVLIDHEFVVQPSR